MIQRRSGPADWHQTALVGAQVVSSEIPIHVHGRTTIYILSVFNTNVPKMPSIVQWYNYRRNVGAHHKEKQWFTLTSVSSAFSWCSIT